MEIQKYFELNKESQYALLNFIEEEMATDAKFQELIIFIEEKKIKENKEILKDFLQLISSISINHHRNCDFFAKFSKILIHLKEDIKQAFTNTEIFHIFKKIKPIIQILLKNNILTFDQSYIDLLISKKKYYEMKYYIYFYPEIKQMTKLKDFEDEIQDFMSYEENFFDNFEQKREESENHSYLCSLIRKDSIEEFVIYVNKLNINLSQTKILNSYFETNSFLQKQKVSLIEYTAFFGSIQIFKYLKMNNVKLTPSLWPYAIHSNNAELISILEENHVKPEDETFCQCFIEAIKCHHNEIANYIYDFLLDKKCLDQSNNQISNNNITNIVLTSLKYHNYYYLDIITDFFTNKDISDNDTGRNNVFFTCCKYDLKIILEFILKNIKIDLNTIFAYKNIKV